MGRPPTTGLAASPITRGTRVLLEPVTKIATALRPNQPILWPFLNRVARVLTTEQIAEPNSVTRELMATMSTAAVPPAPLVTVTCALAPIRRTRLPLTTYGSRPRIALGTAPYVRGAPEAPLVTPCAPTTVPI